jgi:transcriptional repressor NrdR
MMCPYCMSFGSKVTDKRRSPNGTRRRRECLKCKKRFTTYEKTENSSIYVIKKNKQREEFSREKMERGIMRAFEKRPVPKDQIDRMINEIESQIRKKGLKEIKSSMIGEIIMRKIKKLDNIAYIRFASVYRNFQDVEDFKEHLKEF